MSTQGNNFDPWYHHYAERTSGLSASEVRALFAVASRPEVVSLAGGMPYVSALPTELVSAALDRTIRDHGASSLQYGSGQGMPVLREQILDVMALEGIRASADDVVVTTGSQHALELVSKLFLDPGDVVIAEGPSYVTALVVFRSFQAEVDHVAMDEHGLIVIEDNPYGLLYFDSPPPQAMRSVEEDGVVYLGTFSKTFAPGLRVGW